MVIRGTFTAPGYSSIIPGTIVALASSITRLITCHRAVSAACMSAPRSKRREASVNKPSFLEPLRMVTGSKYALSTKTVVVFSVTAEFRPPMIPAKAIGFFPSVIKSCCCDNFLFSSSRVVICLSFFTRRIPMVFEGILS